MQLTSIQITSKGIEPNQETINCLNDIIPAITVNNAAYQLQQELEVGSTLILNTTHNFVQENIPNKQYRRRVNNPLKAECTVWFTFTSNQQHYTLRRNLNDSVAIKVPTVNWEYQPKNVDDLKSWYDQKYAQGIIDFHDFDSFNTWYTENVADNSCFYCGLTEQQSQEIVHKGLLKSARFPIYHVTGAGVNRGYWLEIDRMNPNANYSEDNSVPACYFCNNDKSDVFTAEQYREFIGGEPGNNPRYYFLTQLLLQNQQE